ncbi:MAG TPA: DUF951 domain-containing protein [Bacilli bacterium]|jgi:hypothetical protein|nr:DUF951 domain-containing protein [Bacilli bacterium]HPZ23690.1 DUF951 domain-containing protein [Bacilli bacterium]HQC83358.1 DUF951 domain-containing protein [Bacilli bacterium]
MENKEFNLGDHVIMKKPHACGCNEWVITRVGVDVKIKCFNCGHEIMMDRLEFKKKLKGVIDEYRKKN